MPAYPASQAHQRRFIASNERNITAWPICNPLITAHRRVLEVASNSDDAELQMSGELATGTLAIVLARQGRQAEALEMVEKVWQVVLTA